MLFKFRRIEEGSAGGGRHTTSAAGGDWEGGGVEMEVKLSGEGSLVVFTDDAYTGYRHSIDDRVGSGVEFAGGRCVNCSSSLAVVREWVILPVLFQVYILLCLGVLYRFASYNCDVRR